MSVPQDVSAKVSGTNVTLVTTAETVVIASDPCNLGYNSANFFILAWCQVTTGTSITTLTPRIRRTALVGGTLVSEENPVTVGAAAGSTELVLIMASEARANVDKVVYCLTLSQETADGNGTVLQSGIVVFVI